MKMTTEQIIEPPDWLVGASADLWRQLAWSFFGDGVLTEASRDLFGCFCQVAALRQELVGWVMSRKGPVFIAPDGMPCGWPELEIMQQVAETHEALAAMLGVLPEEARIVPPAEAKSR